MSPTHALWNMTIIYKSKIDRLTDRQRDKETDGNKYNLLSRLQTHNNYH